MDANPQATTSSKKRYAQSPTLVFSAVLVAVYVMVGILVGSFTDPIGMGMLENSPTVTFMAQCDISRQTPQGGYLPPFPIFPWTLLTSIFLHASILHIASNVLFLLFFGLILEEHVSRSSWLTAFLVTGLVGNLTFLTYDLALFFGSGAPVVDCGVGASGSVYGIMGAALGLRGAILIIFLLGLDLFAGGGGPAHIGGLITGIVMRRLWANRAYP